MKKYIKSTLSICLAGLMLVSALLAVSCADEKKPESTTTTSTTTNNNFDDIVIAKDVNFSAKLADQDGTVIANATVIFTQGGNTVASFTTNAEGVISGVVKEGKYSVNYDNLPEGHLGIPSEVTVSEGAVLTLSVQNNTPNGTAGRPFVLTESETEVTLPAGTTVYYSSFAGSGRTFIIENAGVKVNFKGTDYTPDENGKLSFPIVSDSPRDHVTYAIENTSGAELEITVVLHSPLGSMENPIELAIGEAVSANVPKEGIIYYGWVAAQTGTLTVSSADEINNIAINNKSNSKVTEFSNGAPSVTIEVSAGDEILISVSSLALTDSIITFTATCE